MEVAPKQKLYYCEHCKEIVLPVDTTSSLEMAYIQIEPYWCLVTVVKHKKCGNIVKEKDLLG
jgi:hypothetical protein